MHCGALVVKVLSNHMTAGLNSRRVAHCDVSLASTSIAHLTLNNYPQGSASGWLIKKITFHAHKKNST